MDFGSTLKELRTQAGMTQQQLGDIIGVTKSVISFYELQERCPSPETLKRIAAVFHVSTDYLLGIEKRPVLDVSGMDENDIKVLRAMIELLRRKNRK